MSKAKQQLVVLVPCLIPPFLSVVSGVQDRVAGQHSHDKKGAIRQGTITTSCTICIPSYNMSHIGSQASAALGST